MAFIFGTIYIEANNDIGLSLPMMLPLQLHSLSQLLGSRHPSCLNHKNVWKLPQRP